MKFAIEKIKNDHPILWKWECLKLNVTEWLARRLNIHIDW